MIRQQTRVIRYRCEVCGRVFEKTEPKLLNCLVIHEPGSCCHHGEKEVTGTA